MLELVKAYHQQSPLEDKRSQRPSKKSIHSLSYILTCWPTAPSIKVLNPPCWQDPLPLKGLQGKNKCRPSVRRTLSSPTKRYKGCWAWTLPSLVSCPKYKEVPYPPDQHETSSRGTQTSTPQYLGESSTWWWKPPDGWKTNTLLRKGSLKRPSMTSSEQVSQHDGSIQSNPLKKPHQGTKKTEGRLISTCPARMGNDVLPSGSNDWTGGKWLDTLKMTHQGTSPSFPTSLPPKNIITIMTMTPWGPCWGGSYPLWWEAGPPSPRSITHSTNSPATIGVLWPKSIDTTPWMNSAKHCAPKLISSSKKYKWLGWSGASAKEAWSGMGRSSGLPSMIGSNRGLAQAKLSQNRLGMTGLPSLPWMWASILTGRVV